MTVRNIASICNMVSTGGQARRRGQALLGPAEGRPAGGCVAGVCSPQGRQAKEATASLPPEAGEPGRLRRDVPGVELTAGERRRPEEFSRSSPGVGRGGTEMLSQYGAHLSVTGPGRYALQTESQPALPLPLIILRRTPELGCEFTLSQ